MKRLKLSLVVVIIFAAVLSRGDSPITSTHFSDAYMDLPIVARAGEEGELDDSLCAYLADPANPIDVKAAVINAVGWDINGKKNAETFREYLEKKSGKKLTKLRMKLLGADELMCLGYLTVMDDYFHPEKGIPLLQKAAKKNDSSFTIAMVLALAEAQKSMDSDWCDVWKKTEDVLNNEKLNKDMRPRAVEIIVEYMTLYKPDCK